MAASDTATPAEKPRLEPEIQARKWFAHGCGRKQVAGRLMQEYGQSEEVALACFDAMIKELSADFSAARENGAQRVADVFRSIKRDSGTAWGARLRAQTDLERLLNLVERAQHPDGLHDDDVLEAFAFHEDLLASTEPTANQRLRSAHRLRLLLGISLEPERRASRSASSSSSGSSGPRYAPPSPVSPSTADRGIPLAVDQQASGEPSVDELAEFARRQMLQEWEREEQACEAAYEQLIAEGHPPEVAFALVEQLREAQARQGNDVLLSRLQAEASGDTPAADAQPPPSS